MSRDREEVKSEAARAIVRGSEITPPRGRRCSRCQRIIKPENDSGSEPAFCSGDCANAEQAEYSEKKLRVLVLERDKGVCVQCGQDCLALREELDALKAQTAVAPGGWGRWNVRLLLLVRCGFDRDSVERGLALWECDHINPRVKGGPNTLENARTLCLSCHKAATKDLAKGRAAARRPKGRFPR